MFTCISKCPRTHAKLSQEISHPIPLHVPDSSRMGLRFTSSASSQKGKKMLVPPPCRQSQSLINMVGFF